jgi:methyltransferase
VDLHQWFVAAVAAERLALLAYARRNERRLKAEGGIEAGAGHYPLIVLLHGAWLAALWFLVPADAAVHWPLIVLFAGLQMARLWIVASLGRFWTTRVISVAGAPLVRRGPYRHLRHPNYLVVALEIAVLPLAFGAWELAAAFSAANAILLRHRIRIEDRALAARREAV